MTSKMTKKRHVLDDDGDFGGILKQSRLNNSENKQTPISEKTPKVDNIIALYDVRASLTKAFESNQLMKEDLWRNDVINMFETFTKLLKNHHKANRDSSKDTTMDYIFAARCIENVTKVYTTRLDDLYEDVLKLCKFLGRKVAANEKSQREPEDGPADNLPRLNQKNKKRRHVSTVTKNLETLNAKLATHPVVDTFFVKLNSFIGETARADKMIRNLLPSSRSNKGLTLTSRSWDSKDQAEIDWNDKPTSYKKDQVVQVKRASNTKKFCMRLTDTNYRITEEPIESYVLTFDLESDDDEPMPYRNGLDEWQNDTEMVDLSNLSLTDRPSSESTPYKRNASQDSSYGESSEPYTSLIQNGSPAYDTGYGTGLESTPIKPQSLIEKQIVTQDSGIGTATEVDTPRSSWYDEIAMEDDVSTVDASGQFSQFVRDMQPEDAQMFDYTYRSNALINSFYTGPSHWKIFPKKEVQMKPVTQYKRTKKFTAEASLDDLRRIDEKIPKFIIDQLETDTKVTKPCKKFSKNKLIPEDFKISLGMFDEFNCASLKIGDPIYEMLDMNANESFDDDTSDDSEHPYQHFNPMNDHSCDEMEHSGDIQNSVSQFIYKPWVIPRRYKQSIFDIEEIKRLSLLVIDNETVTEQETNFIGVYKKVKKLRKNPADCSSALTFFSLLHAANNKEIRFSEPTLTDFKMELY